jgi:hypothetical protein
MARVLAGRDFKSRAEKAIDFIPVPLIVILEYGGSDTSRSGSDDLACVVEAFNLQRNSNLSEASDHAIRIMNEPAKEESHGATLGIFRLEAPKFRYYVNARRSVLIIIVEGVKMASMSRAVSDREHNSRRIGPYKSVGMLNPECHVLTCIASSLRIQVLKEGFEYVHRLYKVENLPTVQSITKILERHESQP